MTELERRALLGDRQAQEECTAKGIVLPCPCCGDEVTLDFIPAHEHPIVGLPDYSGGTFIECNNCTYAMSGKDKQEVLMKHNSRPAPPIGRCGECKHYCIEGPNVGYCEEDELDRTEMDFCSYYFEPREEK